MQIGFDAKVYRQTTGTRIAWPGSGAAPNLVEIDDVNEVTINFEKSEGELARRASRWKLTLEALLSVSVEISMPKDKADPGFQALRDAFLNSTTLALAVLDGPSDTVGTQGLWADFSVTAMTDAQPLEEVEMATFTLKPAYTGSSHVDPEYVTVGS